MYILSFFAVITFTCDSFYFFYKHMWYQLLWLYFFRCYQYKCKFVIISKILKYAVSTLFLRRVKKLFRLWEPNFFKEDENKTWDKLGRAEFLMWTSPVFILNKKAYVVQHMLHQRSFYSHHHYIVGQVHTTRNTH